MKKIKDENKILIMLALFSISIGLWGNFQQLWLQSNSFNISQIGNVLSIASIDYNVLLLLSTIFTIISALILASINVKNKNEKIEISIKDIMKDKITIIYLIYYCIASIAMSIIAITWSILISTAYENKTDAPYINRIKNEYSIFFSNIRYMTWNIYVYSNRVSILFNLFKEKS